MSVDDPNKNKADSAEVNGAETNGETTKQDDISSDSSASVSGTETPSEKSATARVPRSRRRRVRPSHRAWVEDIMPQGDLTEIFDMEIPSRSDSPEPEKRKPLGPEEWAEVIIPDCDPESIVDESPSRLEWLRQKKENGTSNEFLDSLMCMVGNEEAKAHFLAIKDRVEAAKRWGEELKDVKLDLILHGKDGTGKRRIAQLYAEFLYSIGAVPRRDCKKMSDGSVDSESTTDGPIVLFFHRAHDETFNFKDMLEFKDKIGHGSALIFSYRKLDSDAKTALQETADYRRRLPAPITLTDYNEDETIQIVKRLIKEKAEFDDESPIDIIARIIAQRVMKRRSADEDEFTNIHCISEELDKVCERHSLRLDAEWIEWSKNNSPSGDDKIEDQKPKRKGVSVEDALGPEPQNVRNTSKAWKEIQALVGLHQVKKEIGHLFDLADLNRQRERQGKDPIPIALNRCFLGAPGVGKTTVVAHYGQILSELGLLSKGHVVTKTPDELIGKWIGHTEANTLEALQEAKGGILIIDDAHMLYNGAGRANSCSDVFRVAAIDTLVANISGSPGEDRCVILSGYEENMEQMFLNSNPGLQRRFPMESAIRFESYNDEELCQILDLKMKEDGVTASEEGRKVAREVLGRMRTRPKFGNGGDVVSFLSRSKLRQIHRLKSAGHTIFDISDKPIEPRDFDPDFDRSSHADKHRADIFEGMVGFEGIVEQFRRYQKMADGMRRHEIDPRPHIPWAFVFKGPPGTGKTSTARKVGRLFYDMGLLSSDDVHACSVTDIIGQYVGQTGPKVIGQFERGLGKVLFIDEAYRLTGGDRCDGFAKEAVGEIVDAMTKPRYMGNMVVILAGYGDEMEKLLQTNPGLRSRFPTHIEFPHMRPAHCLDHLAYTLSKMSISVQRDVCNGSYDSGREQILEIFTKLIATKGWANGRDVETLAQRIIGHVFVKAGEAGGESRPGELAVSYEDLQRFAIEMLEERGGFYRPNLRTGNELFDVKKQMFSRITMDRAITNGRTVM